MYNFLISAANVTKIQFPWKTLKINKYQFFLRLIWKLLATTDICTQTESIVFVHYNIYVGVPLKAMISEAPQEPQITAIIKENFWLQDSEERAGRWNL